MALGGLDDSSVSYNRSPRDSYRSPLGGIVSYLELENLIRPSAPTSETKVMRGSVTGHSAQVYLGSGSWRHDSASDAMASDMQGAVPRDELYRD